jgi:hypothetical protein
MQNAHNQNEKTILIYPTMNANQYPHSMQQQQMYPQQQQYVFNHQV